MYNGCERWLGGGGEKEEGERKSEKAKRKMRKARSARRDESRIPHDFCARAKKVMFGDGTRRREML